MAYGIEILNRYGETAVQLDKPAYYKYATGNTKLIQTVADEGKAAGVAAGYIDGAGYITGISTPGNLTTQPSSSRSHYATTVGTYTVVYPSVPRWMPHPTFNLDPGDLVFYDVSTYGLYSSYCMMSHGYTDLTPIGGVGVCEPEGINSLPYTIVSTKQPVASPAETHGMVIYDAAGVVMFDSRQPQFVIFDHFYIDKKIIERILMQGITFDITLSETHADYLVTSPNHISFYSDSSGLQRRVMIKKLSNTVIRLSRYDNAGATGGTTRKLFNDTILIVGR